MKHLYQKYILFFAAFGLLTWAGCSNVLTPPPPRERGLRITVSADVNPRTLYPDTSFSKYVLDFSGPADREDITLQDGQTSATVDLATGDWTITVVGYVTIDGTEYPAAQGSADITIVSNSVQNLTIPISASQVGDDGFFSYSVSYPEPMVDTAELRVYLFGTNQWDAESIDLTQNLTGTIPLAPGYYMMTIQLSNENHTAGRAEVVHIYSNMETKAEYVFVENDFAKTITLSGTVDITIDGEPLGQYSFVNISAYRNADYSDYVFNASAGWQGNTWSMKIAPFDADTPLYFAVRFRWAETGGSDGDVEKGTGVVVTVKDQNIADIALAYNLTLVTLSGTVNVTVNGAAPDNAGVNVYRNTDYSDFVRGVLVNLQENTWSITLLPFDTDTPLYFQVVVNDYRFRKGTGISVTVKDQNISNIDLGAVNFGLITLSGTVDITLNGETPSYIGITAYRNADYSGYAGDANIDLQNNTWSMIIESFDTDTPLYFRVWAMGNWQFNGGTSAIVTAKDQDITGIAIVFHPVQITLSGTVNGTVNGSALQSGEVFPYFNVNASRNADYSDSVVSAQVDPQNNTWSVILWSFDADTTLYFSVRLQFYNGYVVKGTNVSVVVKDQDIDNIDLGTVIFNVITLSGTAEVTLNGETPIYISIRAYRDAAYSDLVANGGLTDLGANTWSMVLERFDTDTPLYFEMEFRISGSIDRFTEGIGEIVTVKDQDISGIAIVCHFTE